MSEYLNNISVLSSLPANEVSNVKGEYPTEVLETYAAKWSWLVKHDADDKDAGKMKNALINEMDALWTGQDDDGVMIGELDGIDSIGHDGWVEGQGEDDYIDIVTFTDGSSAVRDWEFWVPFTSQDEAMTYWHDVVA